MQRGLFITFEGTEGAGKSTLIQAVASRLRAQGYGVTVTREPGGTPLAEGLRELILKHKMNPWTELLLYEASRAEHAAVTVRPALDRGEIVLCDRFTDSSLAYQGHARGLPWREVKLANGLATQGLKPALTVFLDIDPALGLKKAVIRNRFEEEGVEFQEKVRAGFLRVRKEEPRRFLTLEAMSAPPEAMAEKVLARLASRLAKVRPGTSKKSGAKKSSRGVAPRSARGVAPRGARG